MPEKASINLTAELLRAPDTDFTLEQIYRIVCRPPHLDMLSPPQLHSRISRSIGEARDELKAHGYVLVKGERRNSYRAAKRRR